MAAITAARSAAASVPPSVMVEVATLSQIDRLFTDALPPDPFPALLAEAQVQLTVAEG